MPRPKSILEATNIRVYTILLYMAKMLQFTHNNAPQVPKIEGGGPIWAIPIFILIFLQNGLPTTVILDPF